MSASSLRAAAAHSARRVPHSSARIARRCSSTYTAAADEAALDAWASQLLHTPPRIYPAELSRGTLADLFCTLPSRSLASPTGPTPAERTLQQGAPLAPLHTLAFFHPRAEESELARDRTAESELSPPLPFGARRMWAGGAFRFTEPLGAEGSERGLCVGEEAQASARVTRVAKKGMAQAQKGSSQSASARPMVFVHQEIAYARASAPDAPLVEEERVHVYLPKAVRTDRRTWREVSGLPKPQFTFSWTPTPTTLFRFSAVTWNAHLIHLDPVYAREEDGHLERLVHGPLTALMLVEALFHPSAGACTARLTSYTYRAQNPVLVGRRQHVRGALAENGESAVLWAEDDDGVVGMTGEVSLLP